MKPPNEHGVYVANVQLRKPDGTWVTKTANEGKTTMFPRNWDAKRIEAEINSAWANRKPVADNPEMWMGTSNSGVDITGYLTPRTTAFPVYK